MSANSHTPRQKLYVVSKVFPKNFIRTENGIVR
jgi:hypothetical protein